MPSSLPALFILQLGRHRCVAPLLHCFGGGRLSRSSTCGCGCRLRNAAHHAIRFAHGDNRHQILARQQPGAVLEPLLALLRVAQLLRDSLPLLSHSLLLSLQPCDFCGHPIFVGPANLCERRYDVA